MEVVEPDLAACRSCGRSVSARPEQGVVLLGWETSRKGKTRLAEFELACSDVCVQRTASTIMRACVHVESRRLGDWLGPAGYVAFHELLETYWVARRLRLARIPRVLSALGSYPVAAAAASEFGLMRLDGAVASTFPAAILLAKSA